MNATEVEVDGATLHVSVAGPTDAPRLVLLHGALAANRSMLGQVAALKSRFRCFAVDQRGHGKSTRFGTDANPWERFTLDQLVEDARVIKETLAPDAWIGVSMGGIVSAHVAARWPDDVRALALLATAPGPSPRRSAFFRGMTPASFDADSIRLFEAWHGSDYWMELAAFVSQRFQERAPGDYAGERISAYEGPALVLQGEEDELIAPEEAEQWKAWLPQADVRLLPGAHAFFAMEGRRETNRLLQEFLGGVFG